MKSFLLIPLQALGIVLLADFVAGIIHWLEDTYWTDETPIIGPLLIRPNIVHHHFPRFFTKLSWWQSSADLLLVGLITVAGAWWCGVLSWQVWLFVVVSVNANQVHKWSHRTRAENGRVISFLQDIRVLQTPRHHAIHHTDPKNTYYCPVTNLLNPALERIQFWSLLEDLIERATGLGHRKDTSNRGQGPGPAWLAEYRPASATTRADVARPATVTHSTAVAAAASAHTRRCSDCDRCPAAGGTCARPRVQPAPVPKTPHTCATLPARPHFSPLALLDLRC